MVVMQRKKLVMRRSEVDAEVDAEVMVPMPTLSTATATAAATSLTAVSIHTPTTPTPTSTTTKTASGIRIMSLHPSQQPPTQPQTIPIRRFSSSYFARRAAMNSTTTNTTSNHHHHHHHHQNPHYHHHNHNHEHYYFWKKSKLNWNWISLWNRDKKRKYREDDIHAWRSSRNWSFCTTNRTANLHQCFRSCFINATTGKKNTKIILVLCLLLGSILVCRMVPFLLKKCIWVDQGMDDRFNDNNTYNYYVDDDNNNDTKVIGRASLPTRKHHEKKRSTYDSSSNKDNNTIEQKNRRRKIIKQKQIYHGRTVVTIRLVTIFYNLYIPHDRAGAKHAVSVIREQIQQIGNSDLMLLLVDNYSNNISSNNIHDDGYYDRIDDDVDLYNNNSTTNSNSNSNNNENKTSNKTTTGSVPRAVVRFQVRLLYNSIGNSKPIQDGKIEQWCRSAHPQLVCKRLLHPNNNYVSADESVTLQSLYDYCHRHDNTTTTTTRTFERIKLGRQLQQPQQLQNNSEGIVQLLEIQQDDQDDNDDKYNNEDIIVDRDTVVYLHSKGSYHNNEVNDAWRRSLTAAALHEHCFVPPSPPTPVPTTTPRTGSSSSTASLLRQCNLCGLQFYTLFTFFVPGNMWTSSCNYVRKLIPPINSIPISEHIEQVAASQRSKYDATKTTRHSTSNDTASGATKDHTLYQKVRENVVEAFLLSRARGYVNSTLLRDRHDYYGLDRYSTEHWIGSHPDLEPCDLDPIGKLSELFHKHRSKWRKYNSIYLGKTKYYNRLKQMQQQQQQKQQKQLLRKRNNKQNHLEQYSSKNVTALEKKLSPVGTAIVPFVVDEYGFNYSNKPRHRGFVVAENIPAHEKLLEDENVRYKEYYLLPGHLLKWAVLYNSNSNNNIQNQYNHTVNSGTIVSNEIMMSEQFQKEYSASTEGAEQASGSVQVVPSNDSWIWDWFPDGQYWRDGIHRYGIHNVVPILNRRYAFHVGIAPDQIHTIRSAFAGTAINPTINNVNDYHTRTGTHEHDDAIVRNVDFPKTAKNWTTKKTTTGSLHEAPDEGISCGGSVTTDDSVANITLDYDSDQRYVVFYHITLLTPTKSSVGRDDESIDHLAKMLELVDDQFAIMSSSYNSIVASMQKTPDIDRLETFSQQKQKKRRHLHVVGDEIQKKLTVFYTIVTNMKVDNCKETIRVVYDTCSQYSNLRCRFMKYFNQDYEGETLRQLHKFCKNNGKMNADNSVDKNDNDIIISYINNQGPVQVRHEQSGHDARNLILHMTMAATHKLCLWVHHSQQRNPSTFSSCNVCGLIFFTVWTLFFPGNMFSTKCSYVRKLLSPMEYEKQMQNNVVGKILLSKLRTTLMMSLITNTDRRPDYLGLDRYAIEHWIGSHPNLVPCDLSDRQHGLDYWDRTIPIITRPSAFLENQGYGISQRLQPFDRYTEPEPEHSPSFITETPFHWSLAPCHPDVPPLLGVAIKGIDKNAVLKNDGLRLREYHYLAGHILKWFELYNMAPSSDSWAWKWFPDGSLWYENVSKYGRDAINVVTSKYSSDGM